MGGGEELFFWEGTSKFFRTGAVLEEILLEEHQKRRPKPERGAVAIAG